MDTSRLSQGEKIVAISSGLLVLLSFFPLWAKYEVGGQFGGTGRGNAWSDAFSFLSKLAILLALTALVLVILKALGTNLELPVGAGLVYVALGGLSTLLLLLLLIQGPRDFGLGGAVGEALGYEVSRGIMQFVGVVVGAGILFGGYQHMQGETTGSSSPTTPPATPPPAS